MSNEAKKTHCSHKELQFKQWLMMQGRLIVHTRSYNATMGIETRKTYCSHKELCSDIIGHWIWMLLNSHSSTQGIKQQTRLAKTPYHSQAQVSRLELNNK
ncbi:hypothetical protein KSS87_013506, partial [Heliosperma pusillum]